jgi:hypothetical protein
MPNTPPSALTRCWKCGHSHQYSRRIYVCAACNHALCFADLYIDGDLSPISHAVGDGLCGPAVLTGVAQLRLSKETD